MRLLHTSDWHLGASEGIHSLQEDQLSFINQICEIIEQESIDGVIIAGDVYDRSVASADAIRLYDYAMTRICMDLKVPVIIVAGNHDSSERLASCSDLLEKAGLHVQGSLETEAKMVSIGDADIYMLPWFTEEKVRTVYPDAKDQVHTTEDAYRLVCSKLKESFAEGRKHIAVAHAFVTGAETSTSDRAAEIGFATQVGANVFEGFDYVALGHIHKPQNVTENIRYSGTPMPYSFGKEEKQEKSVTIIDTDSMEKTVVPLKLLHERITLTGTLEEILSPETLGQIMDSDIDKIVNGYVRLCITDRHIDIEQLAKINEIYAHALSVTGKTYESEDSVGRMTMEEFRELESKPDEIFRRFCVDIAGGEPDEHKMQLFMQCLEQ